MTADCSLGNRVWVEPLKTPLLEKLSHYFKTRQIERDPYFVRSEPDL